MKNTLSLKLALSALTIGILTGCSDPNTKDFDKIMEQNTIKLSDQPR